MAKAIPSNPLFFRKADQDLKIKIAGGHLAGETGSTISYKTLPLQDRFFNPGERTRDIGTLGDNTLTIDIPIAKLHEDFVNKYSELVKGPVSLPEFSAYVNIVQNNSKSTKPKAKKVTLSAGSKDNITFKVLSGGSHQLSISMVKAVKPEDPSGSFINEELTIESSVIAPWFFQVILNEESLLNDLEWGNENADVLMEILKKAQVVAAYSLRLINVRIFFSKDSVPDHLKKIILTPSGNEYFLGSEGETKTIVIGEYKSELVSFVRSVLKLSDKKKDIDNWRCDQRYHGYSIIEVHPFLGGDDTEINKILKKVTTEKEKDLFTELAGRAMGIQIARAVILLLKIELSMKQKRIQVEIGKIDKKLPPDKRADAINKILENLPAGLETSEEKETDSNSTVLVDPRTKRHTQLTDSKPENPIKDFLGLAPPENKSIQSLWDDLKEDYEKTYSKRSINERKRRKKWISRKGHWQDLCALHGWFRGYWPDGKPTANTLNATTPYDVLAGLFDNTALAVAHAIAPLPLPYSGMVFREGDYDKGKLNKIEVDEKYGGKKQSDLPAGIGNDLIALAQNDLKTIGLHWGHSEVGKWGYLRFKKGATDAYYDGVRGSVVAGINSQNINIRDNQQKDRDRLKEGHSALALREFQIIIELPQQTFERLDNVPVYANRLYPLGGLDVTSLHSGATQNKEINGRMNARTAFLLQQFRFGRRRNPSVVEFWKTNKNSIQWEEDPLTLVKENVIGPEDSPKQGGRKAFVIDRSGLFGDSGRLREPLGIYDRNSIAQNKKRNDKKIVNLKEKEKPDELEARIKTLKVDIARKDEEIKTIEKNINDLNNANANKEKLIKKKIELKIENTRSKAEKTTLQKQIEKIKEKIEKFTNDGKHPRSGSWRGPMMSKGTSLIEPSWKNSLPGFNNENLSNDKKECVKHLMRIIGGLVVVESNGFLDGYNAYDNGAFSIPPFHPTITRGSGSTAGQMGSLIHFIQRPPLQIIERAIPMPANPTADKRKEVKEKRLAVTQKLQSIWYRGYGRFGVGVGWSNDRAEGDPTAYFGDIHKIFLASDAYISLPPFDQSGLRDSSNKLNSIPSMENVIDFNDKKQQALYQSYAQWFRTWPWIHRFVSALRNDEGVRGATTLYMLEYARRTFQATSTKKNKYFIESKFYNTDLNASIILRVYVRKPKDLAKVSSTFKKSTLTDNKKIRSRIKKSSEASKFPTLKSLLNDFGNFTDKEYPDKNTTLQDAFADLLCELIKTLPDPPTGGTP